MKVDINCEGCPESATRTNSVLDIDVCSLEYTLAESYDMDGQTENSYKAIVNTECPKCGKSLKAIVELYEYPPGEIDEMWVNIDNVIYINTELTEDEKYVENYKHLE